MSAGATWATEVPATVDATTAKLQKRVGVSGPFASFQVRVPRILGEGEGLHEGDWALVVGGRTLGSGR